MRKEEAIAGALAVWKKFGRRPMALVLCRQKEKQTGTCAFHNGQTNKNNVYDLAGKAA